MNKKITMISVGICLLIILGGCKDKPSTEGPQKPATSVQCSPEQLVAPTLQPVPNEECTDAGCVTSQTPTLSVYYVSTTAPKPSSDDECVPEETHFYLSTGPDFTDELGGFSTTLDWAVTSPLQPGKQYRWAAAGVSESVEGPLSPYDYFIAGPICTPSQMTPVNLLEPADGSIVDTIYPTFKWENQEPCTPQFFRVDWASKPFSIAFDAEWWVASEILNYDDIFNPVTSLKTDEKYPLEDCETYYWRVASSIFDMVELNSDMWTFTVQLPGTTCMHKIESPVLIDEFLGIKNANCRRDPWINGNEVGLLRKDDTAKLLGVNEDGWWGYFELMNGLKCWVHMSTVQMQPPGSVFDASLYPLIAHDPAPEPASGAPAPASPCTQITDSRACESNASCSWNTTTNACEKR